MSSTRWKATLAGASVFTLLVYFNYANSPWNGPKSKTLRAPAIAQKRRLKGDIYSGHNCVAGSTSGPGQDQTRCIFKNVCLTLDTLIEPSSGIVPDRPKGFVQPSSVRMKYFRPRIAREAPLYWYDEFSLESSWVRIDRDSALTPELVYEPLPNNEEVTWWSPAPVTVLTEAFWPENYGHALGDDFLPIYRLAKSFGLWDRKELGVIFHPDCSKRGGFDRGCENHRRMSELLLDRPIVTASSSIWPEDGSPLCFEKLLVGTRLLGMGMPSEGSWTGFIGEIKSHLGIDPDHQPTKQKITIFDKRGRRTILNPVELKERLEERFQIQVDIINPAAFSLEQQAGMFEDTTVLVSPCGGVSFSSVFLPKGASTIFLDYWNAKWNSTAQMERHIYSWMSDMTPYYYPLELSDLSWNLAAIPLQIHDNESELMRSWVNVTINLDRMERYVLAALIQAEVTLGLSGTFKLEPDGL